MPGAVDMVGDGPGKTAVDERGSTGAYAVTTRPCDVNGDAGRGDSPGVVDGDASIPGEHDAGTPGGSTVIERTPAEAAPTKKRRVQKHSRTAQDKRKRQLRAAGLPAPSHTRRGVGAEPRPPQDPLCGVYCDGT